MSKTKVDMAELARELAEAIQESLAEKFGLFGENATLSRGRMFEASLKLGVNHAVSETELLQHIRSLLEEKSYKVHEKNCVFFLRKEEVPIGHVNASLQIGGRLALIDISIRKGGGDVPRTP